MTREYEALAEAYDWDRSEFKTLNQTAVEAAFCDADLKERLAKKLEAAYG